MVEFDSIRGGVHMILHGLGLEGKVNEYLLSVLAMIAMFAAMVMLNRLRDLFVNVYEAMKNIKKGVISIKSMEDDISDIKEDVKDIKDKIRTIDSTVQDTNKRIYEIRGILGSKEGFRGL